MTIEVKDDNGVVLALYEMTDLADLPKGVMIVCSVLGFPIENITFRLPVGGHWYGVHGNIK